MQSPQDKVANPGQLSEGGGEGKLMKLEWNHLAATTKLIKEQFNTRPRPTSSTGPKLTLHHPPPFSLTLHVLISYSHLNLWMAFRIPESVNFIMLSLLQTRQYIMETWDWNCQWLLWHAVHTLSTKSREPWQMLHIQNTTYQLLNINNALVLHELDCSVHAVSSGSIVPS